MPNHHTNSGKKSYVAGENEQFAAIAMVENQRLWSVSTNRASFCRRRRSSTVSIVRVLKHFRKNLSRRTLAGVLLSNRASSKQNPEASSSMKWIRSQRGLADGRFSMRYIKYVL